MSDAGDPNLFAYLMLWEEELVLDGEEIEADERRKALAWRHRRRRSRIRGVRRRS